MTSPKEYISKIKQITTGLENLSEGTEEEAKLSILKIRQMQKELGLVKKDVNNTIKMIRSRYTAEKAEVGTKFGDGVGAALFGKKLAGRSNAIKRENLRRQQINEISPYQQIGEHLEELILKLNGVTIQLQSDVLKMKSQTK
jgi:hypothetical protein